jgi:tetratricopeptide (TPR) repeat protein
VQALNFLTQADLALRNQESGVETGTAILDDDDDDDDDVDMGISIDVEEGSDDILEIDVDDLELVELDNDHLHSFASNDLAEEASRVVILNVEEAIEEANFFIVQGLLDEAQTIMQDLSIQFPTNRIVADKMAELKRLLGGPSGVTGMINLAEDLQTEIENQKESGKDTGEDGAFSIEDVSRTYDIASLTDADGEKSHYELALAYVELGLHEEARRELLAAIETGEAGENQALANVHYQLSTVYMALGDVSQADDAYKQAIALNPQLSQASRQSP